MLLKKQKGEYGYLTAYRRQKLMITLILACMIAAVILGTIIMFGDTGRVMIVFAILLALPFVRNKRRRILKHCNQKHRYHW